MIDSLFKLGLIDARGERRARDSGPASKNRASDARRNEMAVNPLKSHNPAKWPDFVYNDFNDLRPSLRNVSFRLAKDFLRFAGFSTSQEAKCFAWRLRPQLAGSAGRGNRQPDSVSWLSRRAPVFQRAVSAALAGVGTISRLSKLGHCRLCGDDQGVKKLRNSQPPRPERREPASKALRSAREAPRTSLEGRFRSRKRGYELDNPSRREASLRSSG